MEDTPENKTPAADSFTSSAPAKAPAKEKAAPKRPKLEYGDDVTVKPTGKFSLFDPETNTNFPKGKETKTTFTRFVETNIERGKLRKA